VGDTLYYVPSKEVGVMALSHRELHPYMAGRFVKQAAFEPKVKKWRMIDESSKSVTGARLGET